MQALKQLVSRVVIRRIIKTAEFIELVRVNRTKLTAEIRPHYNFIVCGSGSSDSVV